MAFVAKPIAVVLTGLAVAGVLWNVRSRVSSSGGGGSRCRFILFSPHRKYWLLKDEMNRLDSDLAKLKTRQKLMDLAPKKPDIVGLPDKIARLVKVNEELRSSLRRAPRVLSALKGSAEEYRKRAGFLYGETDELKEKLRKLRSRLKNIFKSIRSS